MKATLFSLFVALLMVGCGEEEEEAFPHDSSKKNINPLFMAVDKGDIEAVKKQLNDGADVNDGNLLNVAIESRYTGRKEIVELLLANGADVNAKNDRGWTPAESLYRTGMAMMLVGAMDEEKADNKEIASLLLKHGAETDFVAQSRFEYFFGKHGDQKSKLETKTSSNADKTPKDSPPLVQDQKTNVSHAVAKAPRVVVGFKQLEERDGVQYLEGKRFTGVVVWKSDNGQKKWERTFKEGKRDCLQTSWYDNGQKKWEGTFKEGEKISDKRWNEDGALK